MKVEPGDKAKWDLGYEELLNNIGDINSQTMPLKTSTKTCSNHLGHGLCYYPEDVFVTVLETTTFSFYFWVHARLVVYYCVSIADCIK